GGRSAGTVGVVDVHRRQVLDVVLGEAELDALVADLGHGRDRDGDLLPAPQVAFLEEHVRHVLAARVDDQPLDPPDAAVGGADGIIAVYRHLAQGYGGVRD